MNVDKFVADQLKDVTVENYEDVTGVWQGQHKINHDLNRDAMEEIEQYIEQGV